MIAFSSAGKWLEEKYGLPLLFMLRGERPAPPEVILVNIDESTFQELDVPEKLDKWNRSLHAQLVNQLHHYEAAVIVFDILFKGSRNPEADHALAEAMRNHGAVIIAKDYQQLSFEHDAIQASERQILPHQNIATSAALVSGFILPKKNNSYISFAPLYKFTAQGAETTTPLAAYHLYASLIQKAGDPMDSSLPNTELNEQFDQRRDSDLYINFYGPPLTINHIPFHELLSVSSEKVNETKKTKPESLKGKIIFVGRTYRHHTKQADYHSTVFKNKNGLNISGVEIMATTFANLLDGSQLNRVNKLYELEIIVGFTLLLFWLSLKLELRSWIFATLVICSLYLLLSVSLFSNSFIFIPVIGPIFLIAPCLMLLTLVQRYFFSRGEADSAKAVLSHYLPKEAIDSINDNSALLENQQKVVESVCLLTDLQGFTSFSEANSASFVHKVMNDYYQVLSLEIEKYGGRVVNIVGDGLLALWFTTEEKNEQGLQDFISQASQNACDAALSIVEKLDNYESDTHRSQLTTCIGIHRGEISLGNLGSKTHFEFAPVGDTVNTTARIEAYNRTLSTRILASEQVCVSVKGIETQSFGEVSLKGKQQTVVLHALVRRTDSP